MAAFMRALESIAGLAVMLYLLLSVVALLKRRKGSMKWLPVMLLALAPLSVEAAGSEALCDALGAACKCSEPLQATSYTGWPGQSNSVYWNPNDTTTKECPGQFAPSEGEVGYAITRGGIGEAFDFTPSSDATILDALPAGHSVSRVLKSPSGYTGGFGIDNTWDAGNVEAARRSIRWYQYYSSDYTLVDSVDAARGCNGKFFQTNNDVKIDRGYGGANIYNFLETVPAQDCCTVGPYPTDGAFVSQYSTQSGYGTVVHGTDVTDDYWNGRWWRVEVILINTDASAGNGKRWRMMAYVKNVTDDWPEVKWFDTVDTTQLAVGGSPLVTANRYGNVPFNNMHINGYRQQGTSPGCVGYTAISHFLAASWDTDADQRIGAATEIEGGTGGGGGGGSAEMPGWKNAVRPFIVYVSSAGITTISLVLQAVGVMGYFWARRAAVVRAACTFWRYAAEIPTPKEMYWAYRYKKTVKRWQAQAPAMLVYREAQTVEMSRPHHKETVG